MTILDLSPQPGGEGLERALRDRPTILAYLEDLQRTGAEAGLLLEGHASLPARVEEVREDPPCFRVRLGRALPEGWRAGATLLFTLDGIRLLAPVDLLERGPEEAWFGLPASVGFADRRTRMRAHFGPREKATVTVLEGFLGARGATGPLLNLSLEGIRMRVERAITVHGKAPIAVGAATFPPGARFPILRIDQLPYSPALVCAGVLAHVSHAADGIQMGIRFEDLGEMEAQTIRQILGRRLPRFGAGFPVRGHREPPGRATVAVQHGEAVAEPPGDPRKAGRRILLALSDGLDRAILASALRAEGYRKVHEARNTAEALDHLKVFPMDLVILGEVVGTLSAADFLARVRRQTGDRTPALLLAAQVDVRTLALARTAQIEHVLPLGQDLGDEFREVLAGLLATL
ncbi:hypothetical protein [Geothrix sp. 21YS21S-2]|uniref:hypothetical protein n=1 Tax=Geothrix sp. 21YS21S-2 TaxID=3068893 RepID=UPI0027B90094|nr:hypothetical protein [Geothrix sp. 21YS21S-2]